MNRLLFLSLVILFIQPAFAGEKEILYGKIQNLVSKNTTKDGLNYVKGLLLRYHCGGMLTQAEREIVLNALDYYKKYIKGN